MDKLRFIGINLNYSALKSYTMRELRTKKHEVIGLAVYTPVFYNVLKISIS